MLGKKFIKATYLILFLIGFVAVFANLTDDASISSIIISKIIALAAFFGMYLLNSKSGYPIF